MKGGNKNEDIYATCDEGKKKYEKIYTTCTERK